MKTIRLVNGPLDGHDPEGIEGLYADAKQQVYGQQVFRFLCEEDFQQAVKAVFASQTER